MSIYYVAGIPYTDELYHHGIKGQKWGARRFQNPDGSLTEAGRARYGNAETGDANYAKISKAFDYENAGKNYEAAHQKKHGKIAKRLGAIHDLARKESGYASANEKYQKAENDLKTKRRLFAIQNNRQLVNNRIEALANVQKAYKDYTHMFSNMAMDEINHMSKKDRELAMQYIGTLFGWDW